MFLRHPAPPLRATLVVISVTAAATISCDSGPSKPVSVTAVEPNSGPAGVATEVRITGMGFLAGASVSIGALATEVTIPNNTTIVAKTSTLVEGTADVIVRNPDGGIARLPGGFTYAGLLPVTLIKVTPASSRIGWNLDITGLKFQPGAVASFGSVPATSTTVLSPGLLRATVPVLPGGVFDVTVTNPDGSNGTLKSGFTCLIVVITASATSVTAGAPISVSWSAPLPSGVSFLDVDEWIGLYTAGVTTSLANAIWIGGGPGDGTVTLTAPIAPGQYEFRYVSGGSVALAVVGVLVNPPSPSSASARMPVLWKSRVERVSTRQ